MEILTYHDIAGKDQYIGFLGVLEVNVPEFQMQIRTYSNLNNILLKMYYSTKMIYCQSWHK